MSGLSPATRPPRWRVLAWPPLLGVVVGVVWQLLSPVGRVSPFPVPLPGGDAAQAVADGVFVVLTGVAGLVIGLSYVMQAARWRHREPALGRWLVLLVLSCVGALVAAGVGILIEAIARGSFTRAVELSAPAPLLAWPFTFCLITMIGSFLAVVIAPSRTPGQPSRSQEALPRSQ